MERLTRTDWTIINEALALHQTVVDGDGVDGCGAPDEYAPDVDHARHQEALVRIATVREKVHQRLDR